jgi:hypothetical protein
VDAGLVAGHFVEVGGDGLPGDAEEAVGDVAFVLGGVARNVVEMVEMAFGVGEDVFVEHFFAGIVDEAELGALEVAEADFADGDFLEGVLFERRFGLVVIEVAGELALDVGLGFGVVVEGGVVDAESVFEGVLRGFGQAFGGAGSGGVEGVEAIGK